VLRVAVGLEQVIDELRAFFWVARNEERLRLAHRRDAANDVEIDAPHEDLIAGGRIWLELVLRPVLREQVIELVCGRERIGLGRSGVQHRTCANAEEQDQLEGTAVHGREERFKIIRS
jgi:hypothetical protein